MRSLFGGGPLSVTKMDEGLVRRLRSMDPADRHGEVPVIVTLVPGADTTALKHTGLRVRHSFETVPELVAGTVGVGDLGVLATLAEVQTIEYDGEINAFDEPGP